MKCFVFVFLFVAVGSVTGQVTNINSRWVVEPEYDGIYYINDSIFLFNRDGVCGVARISGEVVSTFNKVVSATSWPLLVQVGNGLVFVNPDGKRFSQESYDEARGFSEGLAAVCKQGLWGYIDREGKLVIPCQFKKAGSFSDGYAVVDKSGTGLPSDYGYIDKTGKFILTAKDIKKVLKIKTKKFNISPFIKGQAVVVAEENLQREYFLINKEIKVLNRNLNGAPNYLGQGVWGIPNSNNGLYSVDSWRLMDSSGAWLSDVVYSQVKPFCEGLAAVRAGDVEVGKRQIGKAQISEVQVGKLWGFINIQGQEVIPLQYESVADCSEGMAGVKKGELGGYIDKQGKIVIPMIYSKISNFHKGKACVKESDGYRSREMIINKEGKIHILLDEEKGYKYYSDNFIVRKTDLNANKVRVKENIKYGIMRAEPEGPIEDYVNRYVEECMNKWAQQGEFESKEDWSTRLQAEKEIMERNFTKEALKMRYGTLVIGENGFKLGAYDAEKQTYRIETNYFGSFDLQVDKDVAMKFREAWYNRDRRNRRVGRMNVYDLEYCIMEGKARIAKVIFEEQYTKVRFTYSIIGNK